MPAGKFTNKTLSYILSCILPSTITSSERYLKVSEYNFFQQKIVVLLIYLFNHDSSKSTIFMLNMAFDVLLSAGFVKYSKLESFVFLCLHMYFFCIKG